MFSQVRVSFLISSPEQKRPTEVVTLSLNGARLDRPALRRELEELAIACLAEVGDQATKPIVKEREATASHGGGAPMVHFVEFLVFLVTAAASGVVGNSAYDGLKRLRSRVSLTSKPEALALKAQEANRIAAEAITDKFGVPRVELRAARTGFDGATGHVVFDAKDGSTFVVNIDSPEEDRRRGPHERGGSRTCRRCGSRRCPSTQRQPAVTRAQWPRLARQSPRRLVHAGSPLTGNDAPKRFSKQHLPSETRRRRDNRCHGRVNCVRIRRYSGGPLETVSPGQSGSRLIARQDNSADVRLGSVVQRPSNRCRNIGASTIRAHQNIPA